MEKYWVQRLMLFSRFGGGWTASRFSVTPEVLAARIAERALRRCGRAFAGVGGNASSLRSRASA